jgi:phosphatidylethanolamine-binding protein (PEBP) family uncharacterized protein
MPVGQDQENRRDEKYRVLHLRKWTHSRKYTCDGTNVNPPLRIENVPDELDLGLVFDDIDAPRGSYVHWILWNMDPGTKEIKRTVPEVLFRIE